MVAIILTATQLQKIKTHNFASVLFRNRHISKAISALLLVMLLFIHSIKLLHTHSGLFSIAECENSFLDPDDHSEKTSSSDCSVCSYQLGKDVDGQFYFETGKTTPEQNIFYPRLVSFHGRFFNTAFEGRGPPAIG